MNPLTGPNAIDLFCGAGGLSLGLAEAGIAVVAAVDNWIPAVESYKLNFPSHQIVEADLSELDADRLLRVAGLARDSLDLLVGGPPCQGFSIQRIGPDVDARNNRLLTFGRLVSTLRPRMFLIENVPGLLGTRGRGLLATLQADIARAGYDFVADVLDAVDYGVPQRRRRVVICGWRRDSVPPFALPGPLVGPAQYRTVWDAIGDLPTPPIDYSPHPQDRLHRRMKISSLNEERIRLVPPGGGFEDLPVELRVGCHKNGADKIGHRFVYGRLHPHEPAATITARFDSFTRGKFAHPTEHRNISLREGARLQTFPDRHHFVGTQEEIAALIGNAVPPVLARVLGQALHQHLMPLVRQPRMSAHKRARAHECDRA